MNGKVAKAIRRMCREKGIDPESGEVWEKGLKVSWPKICQSDRKKIRKME